MPERIRVGLLISIHAPLAGSDYNHSKGKSPTQDFNPRSPCGERRCAAACARRTARFQSTLPLRGATRRSSTPTERPKFQSTLPLRGATRLPGRDLPRGQHFNPRSPCGERREGELGAKAVWNFNPRSPCGERPSKTTMRRRSSGISIHAPLAGSDLEIIGIPRDADEISIHAPLAGSDRALPPTHASPL